MACQEVKKFDDICNCFDCILEMRHRDEWSCDGYYALCILRHMLALVKTLSSSEITFF